MQSHFEYLYYDRAQDRTSMQKVSHTVNDFPSYLAKKVTLLKHFRSYMHENLNKVFYLMLNSFQAVHNPATSDETRISNLHFLTKYLRTKHGVLFRLSNQILQVI